MPSFIRDMTKIKSWMEVYNKTKKKEEEAASKFLNSLKMVNATLELLPWIFEIRNETTEATTTHMLHIPIVVCQAHGQDQPEMGDNYFSGENRINLVQASQIPVNTI